jgi:hypothetical protein
VQAVAANIDGDDDIVLVATDKALIYHATSRRRNDADAGRSISRMTGYDAACRNTPDVFSEPVRAAGEPSGIAR